MNVVEEKQKQMNKKYFLIILGFVKQWFSIPKIVLTFSMFYCFYLLLQFSFSKNLFNGFFFIVILIEFFMLFKKRKKLNVKFKKTGKKWMLEDIIQTQNHGNVVFLLFYIFQFITPSSYENLSGFTSVIIAFVTTLAIIIGYISLIIIPNKAKKLLEEQYPEYKFTNN